jgi:antitoxin (DNA-binding transcriptional repressor) of toxin-antitoxin stability system
MCRGYTRCMKSLQLSEVGALAEDVRNGETVELRDGERVVAKVLPLDDARLDAHIHDLARRGLARAGSGQSLPDDFYTQPLPKADLSVLEQLLRDRDED